MHCLVYRYRKHSHTDFLRRMGVIDGRLDKRCAERSTGVKALKGRPGRTTVSQTVQYVYSLAVKVRFAPICQLSRLGRGAECVSSLVRVQ